MPGQVRSGKHKMRVSQSTLEHASENPPEGWVETGAASKAPCWLTDRAKVMYEGLFTQLVKPHMLVQADQTALAMFADALTMYVDCIGEMEVLDANGNRLALTMQGARGEVLVRNPLIQVRMWAWDRVMKSCVEFGVTPSSRSRAIMSDVSKSVLDNEFAGIDEDKFFRKPRAVK